MMAAPHGDKPRCQLCGMYWGEHLEIRPGTTARALRRMDAKGARCPPRKRPRRGA